MKITNINALEILDSRGNPTIRTFVTLEDGSFHVSSVPSGASTGSHEAVELRDGDLNRYKGMGVKKAVENVNKIIADAIIGMDAEPNKIDEKMLELDGTPNKAHLGANAMLSVSLAICRASAHAQNQPLWQFLNGYYFSSALPNFPKLLVNIVNGGKHANWNFDIQEFMVVPNSNKPSESVRIASEIFHSLGELLRQKGLLTLVGDEGGYSPQLNSDEEVLDTIIEAAKLAGYENTRDFRLSLDCAATEWLKDGQYYSHKLNKTQTADELLSHYNLLTTTYNLLSIEDPFAEDDWETWKKLTQETNQGVASGKGVPSSARNLSETNGEDVGWEGSEDRTPQESLTIIGDDLFVTNPERIKRGIEEKAANSVLIKVNQIGTMKETAKAINMTHSAGWKTAISHRSGETEDNFIADLAYSCGSEFIKTGSMSRSERLSKYNRLLEIEKNF